jgi:uncharacterized protein
MKSNGCTTENASELNAASSKRLNSALTPASIQARRRLLSLKGDPFVFADWECTLFLHFLFSPDLMRSLVPPSLELDLYEGKACVSLVAVGMRNFRGRSAVSLGSLFRWIDFQRFLNLRTYVRFRDEPGALFLWGWLSNPLPIALPFFKPGLPCVFANLEYDHHLETGNVQGLVEDHFGRFNYNATIAPANAFEPCSPGSLTEFAMERYTGVFCHGSRCRLFRTWHPSWLQKQFEPVVHDYSLITNRFSWFKNARLESANLAPGFKDVWLGRAHELNEVSNQHHAVLSGFYEIP